MNNSVTEWLNSQQENMVKLLGDLVNIDSNSFESRVSIKWLKGLENFLTHTQCHMKP